MGYTIRTRRDVRRIRRSVRRTENKSRRYRQRKEPELVSASRGGGGGGTLVVFATKCDNGELKNYWCEVTLSGSGDPVYGSWTDATVTAPPSYVPTLP